MSFLGRFLVEQGAITEEQLAGALRFQREHNRRIGEVAVDRGVLSPAQVLAIRDRQQEDSRLFGDIAVGDRRLTRRTLDELLFFQKVQHTYLGEALLLCGHIDREQYQGLLGRHVAMRDTARVSLRYLQEFFTENRVAETLFDALGRVLSRLAGEDLAIASIGVPFEPDRYPETGVLKGVLPDGRRLAASVGLSATLAARVAGETGEGSGKGLAGVFFPAVLRYFGDMLRDASLFLTGGRIVPGEAFAPPPEESLFLRCQASSGEAGCVVWLEEAAP
ncbi:hypothetical protein DFW101_3039 [Solidesulfovibrio carbinoliphilus subsp. oakridgensis]|uniref:Uncharacterized protein n=1 Tax=Solidesulfovibrio carbinoliphilus subsp. oakridgensis TaxID=694327 RepID=G7Q782_9BACT|nr:hypothetical protein [Solidesulfovibrio carbinoliphilus]EHJ49039.1 hypothetical protein DFW101_3039 [Solidesulfovibrio carbinoliphilus subsp. oakridgensis]